MRKLRRLIAELICLWRGHAYERAWYEDDFLQMIVRYRVCSRCHHQCDRETLDVHHLVTRTMFDLRPLPWKKL